MTKNRKMDQTQRYNLSNAMKLSWEKRRKRQVSKKRSDAQKARWAKKKKLPKSLPRVAEYNEKDHSWTVNGITSSSAQDVLLVSSQESKKHVSESGATSSEKQLHYADIPYSFMKRLAKRFTLGAEHHGRGNWMRAYSPVASDEDETTGIILGHRADVDFLRDRYNHAIEHLLRLSEGTKHDDHIGAVGWFLAFASQAEELGIDWKEVLLVRTPEQDKDYKFKHGLKK